MNRLIFGVLLVLFSSARIAYAETESKVYLLCHIEFSFQGVVDATYEVDLQNYTVNGFNASITPDKISWKSGDTTITINRVNGYFIAMSEESNMTATGKCEKVNKRMF